MKAQWIKDLYYLSFGKLSVFSLYWNQLFPPAAHRNAFVQVGSGHNYVPGMINIDGNIFQKKDLWLDVTLGFPFQDNSIQGIYASHVMEHFDSATVRRLIKEYYRVCPGGAVRFVVPNLEWAIQNWVERRPKAFPDFPEPFSSVGGRFCNYMLCANQHLLMFDFSFMQELLEAGGFQSVTRETPHHSGYFSEVHLQFEHPNLSDTSFLHVEAMKGV